MRSWATARVSSTASRTCDRPIERTGHQFRARLERRRLTLSTIALFVFVAGVLVTAQKPYPIYTLDDFVKTMKTVGRNFGGVNASLAKNDFEAAKPQLTRSREQLATTVTFWRDHKREDAVQMLRQAVMRMDDLDAALSARTIDSAAVTATAKQVDIACGACHAVYREQDPTSKAYRLKPGAVQ